MKSDYADDMTFSHILAALMPENRLAVMVSIATGLRIDDVLHLRREHLMKERFTIKEMKTGKSRRVYLPKQLRIDLLNICGRWWVFENRLDPKKPRTRQAVYKDVKRAQALFRSTKNLQISPHSARKLYAVNEYKRLGSLKKVQQLLNHSNEAVTILYALADEVTARQHKKA